MLALLDRDNLMALYEMQWHCIKLARYHQERHMVLLNRPVIRVGNDQIISLIPKGGQPPRLWH